MDNIMLLDKYVWMDDRGQSNTTPAPPNLLTNNINSDPHMSKYPVIHSYWDNMFDRFDRKKMWGFLYQKQITPAPFFKIEQQVNSEWRITNG